MPDITFDLYANFWAQILAAKSIDLDTDTIKMSLHTSTYAPNLTTDDFFNDATNELATAGGYTAGGVTLANKATSLVLADSWTRSRANATAYRVGELVRPATGNGFVYICSVAGTSGGSIPTYPTVVGREVTDGTVVWTCAGVRVFRFTSDPVVWAAPFSAGPFRRAVMRVDTAGADSTDPLIMVGSYPSDITGLDGSHTITPDAANGWVSIPLPS
jgi:hypothetical protein